MRARNFFPLQSSVFASRLLSSSNSAISASIFSISNSLKTGSKSDWSSKSRNSSWLMFGFLTVLGAWCYLMPFAYNLGFFASKSNQRFKILTQNLIAHFVFGTGLFIGYYITY